VLLGIACLFYAVNDRLQTPIRKNLEVSTYSIIGQLATVFLIIYGLTVFKDPANGYKLLGAALIIGANVWLFYKPRQHRVKLDNHVLLAIGATLFFATAISIDIGISTHFNLPLYISLTLLLPAIFIALSERIKPREIAAEFKRDTGKEFLITGIAWGLAIFFSLRAFQFGEVNVIVPLQAVGVLLNVLAAHVFLGERSHTAKKLAAAVLVILGVLLTVL
jgi:drug/metabolite transporter (DMT)-like permease